MRIHERKDALVYKLLVSKYEASHVNHGLRGVKVTGASWGFQELFKAIYECRSGFSRVVGNGIHTQIMEDKWVEGAPFK